MDRHLIKRIRQIKGMTQLEFSQELGISRSLIAQVEAGYMKISADLESRIRQFAGDDFIEAVKKITEIDDRKMNESSSFIKLSSLH